MKDLSCSRLASKARSELHLMLCQSFLSAEVIGEAEYEMLMRFFNINLLKIKNLESSGDEVALRAIYTDLCEDVNSFIEVTGYDIHIADHDPTLMSIPEAGGVDLEIAKIFLH